METQHVGWNSLVILHDSFIREVPVVKGMTTENPSAQWWNWGP